MDELSNFSKLQEQQNNTMELTNKLMLVINSFAKDNKEDEMLPIYVIKAITYTLVYAMLRFVPHKDRNRFIDSCTEGLRININNKGPTI